MQDVTFCVYVSSILDLDKLFRKAIEKDNCCFWGNFGYKIPL